MSSKSIYILGISAFYHDKENIQNQLQFKGEIIFPEHHESHAASAFFPSPFGQATIVTAGVAGGFLGAFI